MLFELLPSSLYYLTIFRSQKESFVEKMKSKFAPHYLEIKKDKNEFNETIPRVRNISHSESSSMRKLS